MHCFMWLFNYVCRYLCMHVRVVCVYFFFALYVWYWSLRFMFAVMYSLCCIRHLVHAIVAVMRYVCMRVCARVFVCLVYYVVRNTHLCMCCAFDRDCAFAYYVCVFRFIVRAALVSFRMCCAWSVLFCMYVCRSVCLHVCLAGCLLVFCVCIVLWIYCCICCGLLYSFMISVFLFYVVCLCCVCLYFFLTCCVFFFCLSLHSVVFFRSLFLYVVFL